MEKSDAYRKSSGTSKKWDGGGPGGPGGGPYGGGPRGPPRGLDNVRGLDSVRGPDHSKLTVNFVLLYEFNIFKYFLLKSLSEMASAQFPGSLPACGSCCG